MLSTLAIANYRSLRELIVPLGPLNVITGPNGSGKSNLYRALRLLALTARGGVIPSLAREGGLQSTLWAGPERFSRAVAKGEYAVEGTVRKDAVSLKLGFSGETFGYAIDLGLPMPGSSYFSLDPVIKRECIWGGPVLRPSALLVDRQGPMIRIRDEEAGRGEWTTLAQPVASFDSMMTEFADPRSAPEMIAVREQIRSWRFYDHFRTDVHAPARQVQIGTHSPVLADDGANLAAALQTIREIGDGGALDTAVGDAFPGARVEIVSHEGRFEVALRQEGLLRPLRGAELSDGTLRYLLLSAALLSPRPPALLVLDEPETSLHPDLLPSLARLIARASVHSQVLVVSHAARLVAALEREAGSQSIVLERRLGATALAEDVSLDVPAWKWPSR
ncbi:AAA family ATPase [Paraburkholderia silviterrae]|uniref:ATP-binding protein n=1 Tax=Paraburkholderia silviterrae TaxID=2528715 RepID=A0A4R5MF23_9BURK|nr:AAA family ATPase [Paraburkholderia silviterrae]TDG25534.1 ATP-binding protein [Paraburkholderia silviterrae]